MSEIFMTNRWRLNPVIPTRILLHEFPNDEHSSVVIKCKTKELTGHAAIDSCEGCSVVSHDICNIVSNSSSKLLNTNKNLIDTSGNNVDGNGIVQLPGKIMGTTVVKSVAFCVVNPNYSCILLGRSSMKLYWNVTTGDFEAKYYGINGIHVARARVSPNLNGSFYITLLNVSNQDIEIPNRKLMGYVHPAGEVVAEISMEKTARVPSNCQRLL